MSSIEVRISKGKVSLEVGNVTDASCADITRALENALGTVEEVSRKPEYFIELEPIKNELFESDEE